jgi:hypothetical protein
MVGGPTTVTNLGRGKVRLNNAGYYANIGA